MGDAIYSAEIGRGVYDNNGREKDTSKIARYV
jgi:hypothetical protein